MAIQAVMQNQVNLTGNKSIKSLTSVYVAKNERSDTSDTSARAQFEG